MKNKTSFFGFVAIAAKPKLLATVNSCRKIFSLLPITLAVLFLTKSTDVNSQANPDSSIPMIKLIDMAGSGFDRMYTDYVNGRTRQIYFYHNGVTVIEDKDITPGGNVVIYDTVTKKAFVLEALRNAKHLTKYENKLFYVLDKVNVYSYDIETGLVNFLYKAEDQIIDFSNMPNGKFSYNTKNRFAIFNSKYGNLENTIDANNMYQSVVVGNTIVYAESSYWYNTPGTGPSFRLNVYDIATGKTYSRTDFNILGLFIKTSDSTFLITYDPVGGGASRLALVNVNKDLHSMTFNKEDVLELAMFLAPTIVGTNGLDNPTSPEKYFMNNEVVFSGNWYIKNLRTGVEVSRGSDETYVMNLSTLEETYIGKIANPWPLARFNFANRLDNGRIIMFDPFKGTPYTNKLYGAATSFVKNTKIAGVSVYPNPAVGTTNITIPGNGSVEVYTTTGQLLFSQNFTGSISVPVNSGLNIVKIILGNKTQTFKVLGR